MEEDEERQRQHDQKFLEDKQNDEADDKRRNDELVAFDARQQELNDKLAADAAAEASGASGASGAPGPATRNQTNVDKLTSENLQLRMIEYNERPNNKQIYSGPD